jgi:hypothetical protein
MAKKTNFFDTAKQSNSTTEELIKLADLQNQKAIERGDITDPKLVEKLSGGPIQIGSGIDIADHYPTLEFEKEKDPYEKYRDYISESLIGGRQLSTETLNEMRFENQSAWEQARNAVGRLATNIVPQILSGAASMLDIPGYWDAEHAANNAIVNWANDVKEWSNEAMPIYENPNDAHDFGSSAWWFSRGESLVESIAAFAVTGGLAGKAIQGVASGIKAVRLGAKGTELGRKVGKAVTESKKLNKYLGAETREITNRFAQQASTAVMMNQAEAVMEASGVYKSILEQKIEKGYSYDEARKAAAEGAATTMNINRLNIILNLTSAKMFMSPVKLQKQLIKELSLAKGLRGALAESGQEALEEVTNHIASKKGEAKGMGQRYTWDDILKDATSAEGLEAAFLGALGGAGQKGLVGASQYSKYGAGRQRDEAGNRISAVTANKQNYAKQQKAIEELEANGVKITDAIKQSLTFGNTIDKIKNAKTEEEKHQALKDDFPMVVMNALNTGTQSVVEGMIDDTIANPDITTEERNYAQNAKKLFKDLENIYYNAEEYNNVEEVYLNKVAEHALKDGLTKATNQYNNVNSELQREVTELAKKYSFTKKNEVINKVEGVEQSRTPRPDSKVPLSYSMSNLDENTGDTAENKKVYDAFLKEVKSLPSYITTTAIQGVMANIQQQLTANQEQYREITSNKYQTAVEEQKAQEQAEKGIKAEAEKEISIEKLQALKEKTKDNLTKDYIDGRIAYIKNQKDIAKVKAEQDKLKASYITEINNSTIEQLEAIEDRFSQDPSLNEESKDFLREQLEQKRNSGDNTNEISLEALGLTPSNQHGEEFTSTQDDTNIDTNFTTSDAEDANVQQQVLDIAEKIQAENNGHNTDPNGNTIAYDRPTQGHNRAAYLSRVYKQVTDFLKKIVTREDINNEIQNLELLSKDVAKVGSKIEFVLDEEYDGEVYKNDTSKETIPWKERLDAIKKQWGENYQKSDEYIKNVPIIARDKNGKTLFYVHDTNWIADQNVKNDAEGLAKDRASLVNIRRQIVTKRLAGKKVETKITKKSTGVLLRSTTPLTSREAFPTGSVTFAIIKNGAFEVMKKDSKKNTEVKNKKMPSHGAVVAIVPNGDGQIAAPLTRKGLTKQDAESVAQIIDLWLMQDEKHPAVKQIADATGIALFGDNKKDTSGLRQLLSQYIYLYPTQGKDGLNPLVSNKSTKLKSNTLLITTTGNSIEFGFPNTNKVFAISPNFTKESNKKKLANLTAFLHKEGNPVRANIDLATFQQIGKGNEGQMVRLNDKKEVETVDYQDWLVDKTESNIFAINVGTEEKPEWSTSIQPIIEFDTTFAGKPTTQSTQAQQSTTQSTNNEIEAKKADIERRKKEELVANIYSQLGNKTISGNVVLKSVYQQAGIDYAKSISGIFSLRVNNSNKHFGNPFSSVPTEIAKGLIATKSTKESVEKYIDWVLFSNEERAKWIREQIVSENLKNKPIVYYKELGEPSHATALDFLINAKYDAELKALKALEEQESKSQVVKEEVKQEPVVKSKPLEDTNAEAQAQAIANQEDITVSVIEDLILQVQGQNAIAIETQGETFSEEPFIRAIEILKEREAQVESIINEKIEEGENPTPNDTTKEPTINPLTGKPFTFDVNEDDTDYQLPYDEESESEEEVEEETEIDEELRISEAMKESASNLLLDNVSLQVQYDTINWLTSAIVQEGLRVNKEQGKKEFDTTKILNEKLEELKKIHAIFLDAKNEKKAATIKALIDQFGKIKGMVKKHIQLVTTGKIDDNINEDEDVSGELTRFNYSDEWSLTLDSKKTASANLKKFFSAIGEVTNGDPKTNPFGIPIIIPFDEVYNTLHRILANKKADYQILINTLEIWKESLPWVQSVLDLLENAPQDIKNEFVTDMNKHHIHMEFVLWAKTKNGFSAKIWNSNSSSTEEQLRVIWKSNLKSNTSQSPIVMVDVDGNYKFNEREVDIMLEQAEAWKSNPPVFSEKDFQDPQNSDIAKWLGKLGIVLDNKTYKALNNQQFYNDRKFFKFKELFSNNAGLINVLARELRSAKSQNLSLEDESKSIFNDTVVKELARLDAIYASNTASTSFSAGNKTIYSYGNNKWLINRFRDLLEKDSEIVAKLKELAFTKDSLWLDDLTLEGENSVSEQMKLTYLSLEALKKEFSKSKDDKKLNQLAAIEHEVTKMGFFFKNGRAKINGEVRRKVGYFYPSTSDKSGQHIIHQYAHSTGFKREGDKMSFGEEILENMYNSIILPELHRIHKGDTSDIQGYKPQYFYFIPKLNTEEIFEGKTLREIAINGDVNDEVKEAVKQWLNDSFLPQMVENKVQDWLKLGVVDADFKNINFINADYFKSKKNIGTTTEDRAYFAAADYVLNYAIANAEMYKLFVGDPALYAKWNDKKSIDENIKATYTQLAKRLAGDVAPGMELSNSIGDSYIQVFINDKASKSKTLLDEVQKAFFTNANPDFEKDYQGMKGSDAQEFTTWKEHLKVMYKLGRLTTVQYEDITKKLRNKQDLNAKDLKLVLQPMKPVYAGNVIKDGIDRRIYIKSSSFPLLPQFTKSFELNKLREALEKYETSLEGRKTANGEEITVRASFNTANKIGAVKNSLDLYDDKGNISDKLEIKEENTLQLPRENFRIQQDVPYKEDKDSISVGSQEMVLLFSNLLDVPGFKLEGSNKPLSGAELKQMYLNTYNDLFKYKQETLRKRLKMDREVEIFSDIANTTEENSIFEKLEKAKTKRELRALEVEEGNNVARAKFINENFDTIIEEFAKNKINVFTEQKGNC